VLNRRIRGLQKELEDVRSRVDVASTAQQEAVAAAMASKASSFEDLKATDMRIISEVPACFGLLSGVIHSKQFILWCSLLGCGCSCAWKRSRMRPNSARSSGRPKR
jgi:hypothetical protein